MLLVVCSYVVFCWAGGEREQSLYGAEPDFPAALEGPLTQRKRGGYAKHENACSYHVFFLGKGGLLVGGDVANRSILESMRDPVDRNG